MPQFDVFEMRPKGTFVIDVQSDLLEPLNTRVVVPLMPVGAILKPAKRLNPVLSVGGDDRILATQFLTAVPKSELRSNVGSLVDYRDEITAALDMLYQGF